MDLPVPKPAVFGFPQFSPKPPAPATPNKLEGMEYTQMDEEAQIAAVQELVPGILKQYDIEAAGIENVNHSFNSAFKITDTKGNEYALRINLASGKSNNEVLAEMQWLEALAEDGSVLAPVPVRTTNNELLISTPFTPLGKDTTAVLFNWIPGEEVGDEPTSEQLFELGQNMARLQIFSKTLSFTEPAYLPSINRTLMNTGDNLRPSQPKQINEKLYGDILKGLELSDEVYARLSKEQELLPIHADLHNGNVIKAPNKLAIIDFDDAGIGLPIQDLVISTYYIREDTEKEKHLREGYASLLELPKISDEDFEILVMGRLIGLVSAVTYMTSAEIIEFIPTFLERTQQRLDHFFATGKFLLKSV
jgi:Ser/Thr protein kinase RdoA (MazF antagonist)